MSVLRRVLRLLCGAGLCCAGITAAQASLHTVTGLPRQVDATPLAASAEMDAIARAAVARASSLLAVGDRPRALETLSSAQIAIANARPAELRAQGLLLLGRAYLQTGQFDSAEPLLMRAGDAGALAGATVLQASAYNDLGLLYAARNDDGGALRNYRRGRDLLQAGAEPGLQVRLSLNMADILRRRGEVAEAMALVNAAIPEARRLEPSAERVHLLTAIAARLLEWGGAADGAGLVDAAAAAEGVLELAREDARKLGGLRAESEALGLTGRLRELRGEDSAAIRWTRRAIFAAQAAAAPDLLYRWEWQAGRVMAHKGDPESALAFYRRAVASLRPIQHDVLLDLRATRVSYRESIGPLFTEFADLLLRRSSRLDAAARQAMLRETRSVIEQLKTVELEDYFRDDCVVEFQGRQTQPAAVPQGTAVLYPIAFPDRLELLLSLGPEIHRVTVKVGSERLRAEALAFRTLLQLGDSEDYLGPSQQLHSWLIAPLTEHMAQSAVDTLVVVPDGPLLGIPFAALHDGRDFLVRNVSVATVPGLHLVEPRATREPTMLSLVGGLMDSVQGFPALPNVGRELDELSALYDRDARVLRNQQFTASAVEQYAGSVPYSVVHIASHAQFDSDPRKTFLLTYDDKLGMAGLERLVKAGRAPDDPVDLLTLSACQTAVGDERAALGLAGVAIKAGARSVVATLWHVNDEATSELIRQFYRGFLTEKQPKSQALRAAQLKLMDDARYRHPRFWAPFLVIGNWN